MTTKAFAALVVMFTMGAVLLVIGILGLTEIMAVQTAAKPWQFTVPRVCLLVGFLWLMAPMAHLMRRVHQLEQQVAQLVGSRQE